MTDTKTITFEDIVNIGKRRVDDTTTVEVQSLGGSIKIRQISGAEHDAALAKASEGGAFDQHVAAREQIKAAWAEPALPADEADAIIDNLPVKAFGEIHALVTANNGLGATSVEEVVKMFRIAADASGANEDGGARDHGGEGDQPAGVGSPDSDSDDGTAGVAPVEDPRAGDAGEADGEAAGAPAEDGTVTA